MNGLSEITSVDELDDDQLRTILELAVRAYSQRTQSAVDNGGSAFAPIRSDGAATATDVMITVRNMLKVLEIAPFELSMLHY